MIEIRNVSKSYGEVKALNQVNFSIKDGELFGLIGPDGAGKTSLMRMMVSLLLPSEGTLCINGLNVDGDFRQIRRIMGYMPGRFSLYPDLTVAENLDFFASVFGTTVQANYHLIRDIYVQLEPFANRRAGKLSGGMKQKLALCCALIHKPDVLVLDEPTTGVDAVSRKEFWEMLRRLHEMKITIVVSTPYMDEAAMCDRIALMQHGEILGIDTPENIAAGFPEDLFAVRTEKLYTATRILHTLPDVMSVHSFGQYLHVVTPKGLYNTGSIEQWLQNGGVEMAEVRVSAASIEDMFMYLLSEKDGRN